MSLLARHRYLISHVKEAFELDEITVENAMLAPDILQIINHFFTAEGPTKILVTFDEINAPEMKDNEGKLKQMADRGDERVFDSKTIRVHENSISCQTTMAVFFVKVRKQRGGDEHVVIDPNKYSDGTLSFGVIHEPLESLEALMRSVYRPIVQDLSTDIWGEATLEQRNEFTACIDVFIRGLQENIRNLSGGLELPKPDLQLDTIGVNAAALNPQIVMHAMNLLYDWCRNIENYLDDSSRSRWETPDSGPDTELGYWRNRLQRLTSITEQIKSKCVKMPLLSWLA